MREEKNRIILGIDPGTAVTGFGVIELKNGKPVPLLFGAIRPPAKATSAEKYYHIFKGVEELILRFSPTDLSVETQFVYKNAQSAMKLGMARGVILVAAAKHQVPVFEYAPTKAKKAVVGQGSASKEQVQKMIQLLLCLKNRVEPEDAADALSLALCHAHTIRSHVRIH